MQHLRRHGSWVRQPKRHAASPLFIQPPILPTHTYTRCRPHKHTLRPPRPPAAL